MPAPGARSKALKQGLAEYWTGKPCPRGHITQRRTLDASCLGCKRNGRPHGIHRFTCEPRPPVIKGSIALLDLGGGHVSVIDAADAPLVARYNWIWVRTRRPNVFYAGCQMKRYGKWTTVLLHRFLTGEREMHDHRDGDGLNNRRVNLRPCTHSQNGANRGPQKNSKTGVKGVFRYRDTGKFLSYIMVRGKSRYLGIFDRIEDASAAYRKAAEEAFGEFARAA